MLVCHPEELGTEMHNGKTSSVFNNNADQWNRYTGMVVKLLCYFKHNSLQFCWYKSMLFDTNSNLFKWDATFCRECKTPLCLGDSGGITPVTLACCMLSYPTKHDQISSVQRPRQSANLSSLWIVSMQQDKAGHWVISSHSRRFKFSSLDCCSGWQVSV